MGLERHVVFKVIFLKNMGIPCFIFHPFLNNYKYLWSFLFLLFIFFVVVDLSTTKHSADVSLKFILEPEDCIPKFLDPSLEYVKFKLSLHIYPSCISSAVLATGKIVFFCTLSLLKTGSSTGRQLCNLSILLFRLFCIK